MSNIQIIILFPRHPDLRLRSIKSADIENLRCWKNNNKEYFFLRQDITVEQQQKWFEAFMMRPDDHMFIVEQKGKSDWEPIGCMGFRKLSDENCVDAYNIIRAVKLEPATFSMSDAFLGMLAYASSLYPDIPIRVKVLSHNPAIRWYEKNGFSIISHQNDHVLMDLDTSILKKVKWNKH